MTFTFDFRDQELRNKVYEFCKDHYYCGADDNGIREKWEPFEYDDDETIEEHIENDCDALFRFLEGLAGAVKPDPDKITVSWCSDDVLSLDNTLSIAQVRDVLSLLKHKHDASVGINWDVIRIYIDEVKFNQEA